jgi:hypothetical protein
MRMIRKRGEEEETRKEITTVTIERKTIVIAGIVLATIEMAKEILLAIVTTRNPRRIGEIALVLFQSRETTTEGIETGTTNAKIETETMTDETNPKTTTEGIETGTTNAKIETETMTDETNPKTTNAEKKTEENTQTLGKEIGMRMATSLLVGGIEMVEMEKVTGLRVDRCVW